MIRFYLLIILNLHLCLKFLKGLNKILKNPENYTDEMRYQYCREIVHTINKKGKINVEGFGTGNLPQNTGYVLYSNHQGRYDAIGVLETHEAPCRVVIKKNRGKAPLIRQFLDVLQAKKLEVGNLKGTLQLFKEVEQEIMEGKKYLIFPEGIYHKNKNTLQEFHTGCMRFLHNAKCPIVPVAIYDTYKVFNVNSLKKVHCEVHYLSPIYYEEYENLSKNEIAELIKSRIQEKINERNLYYKELKNNKKRR